MNGGGRIHLTTSATLLTPSLHLHRFMASSFLKPILLMFPSTWSLHFIFGRPCLRFPSTSCTIAIFLRSSQNMTIPSHTIRPCRIICYFLQSRHIHQLRCIPIVHRTSPSPRSHIDLSALLKIATSYISSIMVESLKNTNYFKCFHIIRTNQSLK